MIHVGTDLAVCELHCSSVLQPHTQSDTLVITPYVLPQFHGKVPDDGVDGVEVHNEVVVGEEAPEVLISLSRDV